MAKQKVPEEMLKAAHKAAYEDDPGMVSVRNVQVALATGLHWQSENPPVPTKDDMKAWTSLPPIDGKCSVILEFADWWVRHMYAFEEVPEVCPAEKALRDSGVTISDDYLCPKCGRVHEAIIPKTEVPEAIQEMLKNYEDEDCYLTVKIAIIAAYERGLKERK